MDSCSDSQSVWRLCGCSSTPKKDGYDIRNATYDSAPGRLAGDASVWRSPHVVVVQGAMAFDWHETRAGGVGVPFLVSFMFPFSVKELHPQERGICGSAGRGSKGALASGEKRSQPRCDGLKANGRALRCLGCANHTERQRGIRTDTVL